MQKKEKMAIPKRCALQTNPKTYSASYKEKEKQESQNSIDLNYINSITPLSQGYPSIKAYIAIADEGIECYYSQNTAQFCWI